MPKVQSYAPGWLNAPAPAHVLFAQMQTDLRQGSHLLGREKHDTKGGARRTIARRGTEVFVAAGREIRWGDLVFLRDAWEDKEAGKYLGTRVKRENSGGPDFEVYDDELDTPDAGVESAQGFRVRIPCPNSGRLFKLTPRVLWTPDAQDTRCRRYQTTCDLTSR
jgi:nucleoporin NUP82